MFIQLLPSRLLLYFYKPGVMIFFLSQNLGRVSIQVWDSSFCMWFQKLVWSTSGIDEKNLLIPTLSQEHILALCAVGWWTQNQGLTTLKSQRRPICSPWLVWKIDVCKFWINSLEIKSLLMVPWIHVVTEL